MWLTSGEKQRDVLSVQRDFEGDVRAKLLFIPPQEDQACCRIQLTEPQCMSQSRLMTESKWIKEIIPLKLG